MYELDEKDMQILEVLKQNSHLSIGKIARKTGIPIATVHHRIKKLKTNGIIKRYTIEVDQVKLGRKMIAYVMVKAMRKADQSVLLHTIAKHDHVEEGAMITGEFDLVFKVRVKDIDELNAVVIKYMRTLDEVAETRTFVSYEIVEK
jgi:DNA-binding Lrp family transcriptional regulator